MKKTLIPIIASLLAACSPEQLPTAFDPGIPYEPVDVTINFRPYTSEPLTKAYTAISSLSTHLDIWITDGETITDFHQTTSDSDFGTLVTSLNKNKTHTIYAIAHKANGAATLEDGVISLPDDKMTDMFFYKVTFDPQYINDLDCVMTRIIGMFRLETTDAVPDEVKKFRFTITGSGNRWDVSGHSTNVAERVSTININSLNQDGTVTFNVYVMPENQTATTDVSIVVAALDANEDVVETKTFSTVPIKAGYKTIFRGAFFTSQDIAGGFTANAEWTEFDVTTF